MSAKRTARSTKAPTPTPTPIPIFAPFELLTAPSESSPIGGLLVAELVEGLVSVWLVSVVVVVSEVPVLDDDAFVVVTGRNPPCHATLSPFAVPKLTMLANLEASVKATVLEEVGHQHDFAVVTVPLPRFASQATHSFDVPLQYDRPTHESP